MVVGMRNYHCLWDRMMLCEWDWKYVWQKKCVWDKLCVRETEYNNLWERENERLCVRNNGGWEIVMFQKDLIWEEMQCNEQEGNFSSWLAYRHLGNKVCSYPVALLTMFQLQGEFKSSHRWYENKFCQNNSKVTMIYLIIYFFFLV